MPPAPGLPPFPVPDRCFSAEKDLEIFNCCPFPVSVCDYHPDRQGFLWANNEMLRLFGKQDMKEILAWDFSKASDGVKRMHDDYYQTVQVKLKHHGPTRRTVHSPHGPVRLDFHLVPLKITQEGFDEPRVVSLVFNITVAGEGKEAVCGQYMVDRVPSLAMLFVQETGKMIQQNSKAVAHNRRVCGSDHVTLQQVLEGFVWESEDEMDATLEKIIDLEVGEGAVVLERTVKLPDVDEATCTEMWWNMKFEATLDPTPGVAERGAILVSGQDVSEQ